MEGYTPEDRELLREMRRVRRRLKGKRLLWSLIIWALIAAAAGWFLMSRYCMLAVANGPDMGMAVPAGSTVLVFRLQPDENGEGPAQGDVIVFERDGVLEIKRVAAMGGDEMGRGEDGQLTVNGETVSGISALWPQDAPELPFTVPEGEYFVVTDRDGLSADSRSAAFGTVEKDSVAGIAKYVIWPAFRIGEIK